MVDYVEAIKRPFTDLTALVIGIIMAIIPVVNIFVPAGYAVKSAQKTFGKDNALPKWDNWGDIIVKGIVVFIIDIIYMIPAFIFLALGVAGMFAVLFDKIPMTVWESGNMMAIQTQFFSLIPELLAAGGIPLIIGVILAVVAAFITPMAVIFYAKENRFGAAFKVGEVLKTVLTGPYIISWIIVIIYGGILSLVLSIIPYIGSAIAAFIVLVTSYTVFAQAYMQVKGQ
ncbi:MAG: DUF4013 domain-containing protein [archaeon]